MTSERWQRVRDLFHQALEMEEGRRALWLEEVCGGDLELQREVESLLSSASASEGFIEDPVLQRHAAVLADSLGDSYIGRMVGPYRIEAVIGQGGMGTVYRAVRADGHFSQQVAIKIVKRGMDTSHILRRFRHERQILASLDHPNIARLLDGGSTEDGLPYFVMEYIQGQPVNDYCQAHSLSVDERLRLFQRICSAVQHAHTRRVIHRDIKPGNILITAGGIPKLLDFGIAKLMHPESVTPTDAPTITAMLILTPEYASPEQILGDTVTAASDIYSLGVLLYELITGKRPFELEGKSIAEILRVLSEQEARRPGSLSPVGRDLDAIILKAIRREPPDRYPSVDALSEDIERYLGKRPVLARKGWLVYRGRRFLRRHGTLTAITALVLLVLMMALAGPIRRQLEGGREASASIPARPSIAVLGFRNLNAGENSAWLSTALSEMLVAELAVGEQLRTVSGETVAQVRSALGAPDGGGFAGLSLVRLRRQLGADYIVQGSYLAAGDDSGRLRLDLRMQDARSGDNVLTLVEEGSEKDLAALVSRAGARIRQRLGLAPLSSSQAALIRATLPANTEAARHYSEGLNRLRIFDTVAAREHLEKAARADPQHALTRSALAMALASLGDDARAREQAGIAYKLASTLPRADRLFVEGRYYETIGNWEKAVEIYRSLFGFFPDSVDYGLRLADAQTALGRGREALETLDALRRLPPPAPEDPRIDLEESAAAASVSDFERQRQAAERGIQKGLAQGSSILVARGRLMEGRALQSLGRPQEAIRALEESRRLYEKSSHRRGVAMALNAIAAVRQALGESEEALRLYEESLAIARQMGNRGGIAASVHNIAALRKQAGDFEGARQLYQQSIEIRREIGDRRGLASSLNNLANVLLEQGRLKEASAYYEESLAIAREIGENLGIARVIHNVALVHRFRGQLEQARRLNLESLSLRRQVGDTPSAGMALFSLGQVYEDMGDLAQARKHYLESLAIQRSQGNKRAVAWALYGLGSVARAEDDRAAAYRHHEDALRLRREIGDQSEVAQSLLLGAQLLLDAGRPAEAVEPAREAATIFQRQSASHLECSAQAVLAYALARSRQAEKALASLRRAQQLLAPLEYRELRLGAAAFCARTQAELGRRAEALTALQALLLEATQFGFLGNQLEIRLALGEVELATSAAGQGRARLQSLVAEAENLGFQRVANLARAAVKRSLR